MHRTVPANPQQNGVVERMNRSLLERVRCMLLSFGLPKNLWREAVSTAAILINNSHLSSIGNEIPNTRWYGRDNSYITLRIFGCRAYAHCKQGKLNPRALKCLMVGYQLGVKGYRLWCTEKGNQKIIISRDVIFDEGNIHFLNANVSADSGQRAAVVGSSEQENGVEIPDGGGAASMSPILDETGTSDGGGVAESGSSDPQTNDSETTQNNSGYKLARDRVRRDIKTPTRFNDYEMSFFALCVAWVIENAEPSSYAEVIKNKESDEWLKAMKDEIESLMKNWTWTLVKNHMTQKIISCKWKFKKKIEVGKTESIRFKARLVAR